MNASDEVRVEFTRDAVRRVLATDVFERSPQLSAFLAYIVEEELAGRGDRLKSYTIATDALGRPASFDGSRDPIVRVLARRLRQELTSYYEGSGKEDPVVIRIPSGRYQPVFVDKSLDHCPSEHSDDGSPANPGPRWSSFAVRLKRSMPTALAALSVLNLIMLSALLLAVQRYRSEADERFSRLLTYPATELLLNSMRDRPRSGG